MDQIKIWNNVAKNISFYTLKTADRIPEASGVYAWFLPLWLYQKDINKTLHFVQQAMLYDSDSSFRDSTKGESVRDADIEFNWDSVNIRVKKTPKDKRSNFENWDSVRNDDEAYDLISETLMKASIFSRPLYIGRTNNLKSRYLQHTDNTQERNSFNIRFNEFVSNYNQNFCDDFDNKINITVHDLIFAVIKVNSHDNNIITDKNLTELLESALMKIAQPPFSSR